jgi:phage terminase large subunit-like protein
LPRVSGTSQALLEALPLVRVSLQHKQQQKLLAPPWVPLDHQKPPAGDWLYWCLIAGRGAGKTDAGAHYVNDYAHANPGARIAIIAPTAGDARSVCVEGETGLIKANPAIAFNRSWGELRWPNGARAQLFGAYTPDDAERLRGPQHHLVWCDEFAAWRQLKQCWDMMRLGLRLGAHPHVIITTTPKPRPKLLELLEDSRTEVTWAHTDDNPHLHPDVRAELYNQYGGTRLGRQELAAELLTDIPGALWTRDQLEQNRVREAPDLLRIVVAIDPSGGSTEGHAEVGIVAAGKGADGHAYVLRDCSERLAPERWARRAVQLYHELKADRIVAEKNFGGDMCEYTIKSVDPTVPVKLVTASRGKQVRAEPVSSLDEQGKIHHVGMLAELEDQLCNWVPDSGDPSPDRLDARVWAITELLLLGTGWGMV